MFQGEPDDIRVSPRSSSPIRPKIELTCSASSLVIGEYMPCPWDTRPGCLPGRTLSVMNFPTSSSPTWRWAASCHFDSTTLCMASANSPGLNYCGKHRIRGGTFEVRSSSAGEIDWHLQEKPDDLVELKRPHSTWAIWHSLGVCVVCVEAFYVVHLGWGDIVQQLDKGILCTIPYPLTPRF